MRKTFCLAAGLAIAFSASIAKADMTANFFLDARDNFAQIFTPTASPVGGYANNANSGVRGDGQTIYVAPKVGGAEIDPNTGIDTSLATMTLYVDVDSADSNEVLAAVGLDMSIAASDSDERQLAGASVAIHNTAAEVESGIPGFTNLSGAPWNQVAESTPFSTTGGGIKMVRIPVEDDGNGGAMFNAGLGVTNNDSYAYRLATVTIEADTCGAQDRGCQPALDVYLSVNNLLVTSVSSSATPGPVALGLGYNGVNPDPALNGDTGSDAGATSALPDAVIIIKPKGDFDNDGDFDGFDLSGILPAIGDSGNGLLNQREVFTGDFNGDGKFDGFDLTTILNYLGEVGNVCTSCP